MLTGTNISELFDFYLKEYCPEEIIILETLKYTLLNELKLVSDNLKKTSFKDFPPNCYITQRELDIYSLIGDEILDTCLTSNHYNLSCNQVSAIRKIFNISPSEIDKEMIAIIDYQTGKIICKKNLYPDLRRAWTEYLSFSTGLMSDMLNFLICLEANKVIFTEGKVKDLIKEYGSSRRYKM
jgi:hypothetical protein